MYTVHLAAFPQARHERLERVVHKHNRRLDHLARKALLHEVAAGRSQLVARYVEAHAAHNAARELELLGATVVQGEDKAVPAPEAA